LATFVQRPIDPASAHDLQALPHADVQHTPWAQKLELHSLPIEQNAPIGFNPHERPVQNSPAAQLASTVHASKQRLPLHANGAQASEGDVAHVPVALHVPSGLNTPALHCSGAHTVPGRNRRQALAPSHFPSVPQVEGACAAHRPCGSSPPAGTAVHVPIEAGSLQLRQTPSQAPSQQMPSAQNPLRHSLAAEQVRPFGFLPQLPFWQLLPDTQSSSLVHALTQAPAAQR